MANKKAKPLKGYICGEDTTDISLGASDVVIYPSVSLLKKKRTCWKECGILEIDLSKCKTVLKGNWNYGK